MRWIVEHIELVLIASGVLTCSMLLMAVVPGLAMRLTFGVTSDEPVARLIARSWGAMIFASGLMLIYAAYHPEVRLPILLYAIAGKLGFAALVLAEPRVRRQAMTAAVTDLAIVALLGWYLVVAR